MAGGAAAIIAIIDRRHLHHRHGFLTAASPQLRLPSTSRVCAVTELSRSSIVVNADPAAVMKVIADFPSYPQWITFIQAVEVLDSDETGRATVVRFVLDAGVVVDDYALAYTWADDEVSWRLVRATSIKAMDGSYRLTPS